MTKAAFAVLLAALSLVRLAAVVQAAALDQLQAAADAVPAGSPEALAVGAGTWPDANHSAVTAPVRGGVGPTNKDAKPKPTKTAGAPAQEPRSPFSYTEAGRPRWAWNMPIRSWGDVGVSFLGFAIYVGVMAACAVIGAAIAPGVGGAFGALAGLVAGAFLVPAIMRFLGF